MNNKITCIFNGTRFKWPGREVIRAVLIRGFSGP